MKLTDIKILSSSKFFQFSNISIKVVYLLWFICDYHINFFSIFFANSSAQTNSFTNFCITSSTINQRWMPSVDIIMLSQQNESCTNCIISIITVSYTHLTLPTICSVQISVVAVSLKKKNIQE
eukprot:TRINITY_DN2515_c0_g1_i3.p1 TRINITY_DN2515_c0_g1~~TRINITY_DN2515_c0_g1_i3.p1  ORF type:complete len:123 (-),score=11.75 TRINITY_DN2515_c0_g1_i3:49-417(-)